MRLLTLALYGGLALSVGNFAVSACFHLFRPSSAKSYFASGVTSQTTFPPSSIELHQYDTVLLTDVSDNKMEVQFALNNTTDAPLEISSVLPTCACTSATIKDKVLPPHATTNLVLAIDTHRVHGAKTVACIVQTANNIEWRCYYHIEICRGLEMPGNPNIINMLSDVQTASRVAVREIYCHRLAGQPIPRIEISGNIPGLFTSVDPPVQSHIEPNIVRYSFTARFEIHDQGNKPEGFCKATIKSDIAQADELNVFLEWKPIPPSNRDGG